MFIEIFVDYKKIGRTNILPIFEATLAGGYYTLGDRKSGLEIKLKQRTDYPTTYCKKIDNENIVLGYGSYDPTDKEEFLQIIVSKNGDISVRRDLFVTLPLFYSYVESIFCLSNDYQSILSKTPKLTANNLHILETLIPNPDRHTTLWDEIKILDERTIIEIIDKKMELKSPAPRNWAKTKDAPTQNPKAFSHVLGDALDSFINTRLKNQHFGFEISAGVDSSLLPLYFSSRHDIRGLYGGYMELPDSFGFSQNKKMKQLQSYTGLEITSCRISYEDNYPLARVLEGNIKCFYTFEEIYTEALDELAKKIQNLGLKVIATGIGGDELFENVISKSAELRYGDGEVSRRKTTDYAPFLTPKYIAGYINSTPKDAPYPMPLLAISTIGAGFSRNNVYINRDIWPVSPFAQPNLYEFCQGLPVHFRANKNILRAFYQANNYPSVIYNPTQNEHFGLFFDNSLKLIKYKNAIDYYVKNSKVAEMGYIDTDKVLETYVLSKKGNSDYDRWLFNIFTWLTLELNLDGIHK